jgi:DNA gyrase/topoisomerase IV subunit A
VKTYEVDEGKREARGQSIMQLLMMDQAERITAVVRVAPNLGEDTFMVMATAGRVRHEELPTSAVTAHRDG